MSIYQCEKCGCAENTALGWYHARYMKSMIGEHCYGVALCSACAPEKYKDGSINKKAGKWHGRFDRVFFPKGSCFANNNGNLEHKETGLIGKELYRELGSNTECKS